VFAVQRKQRSDGAFVYADILVAMSRETHVLADLGGMLRTSIISGSQGGWQRGAWYFDVSTMHDLVFGCDDPRPLATEEEVKEMLFAQYVKRVKKACWGGVYSPQ